MSKKQDPLRVKFDGSLKGALTREEIMALKPREDAIPEWIYGEDGQPKCTEFVPMGQKIPEPRCPYTMELPL